MSVSSWRYMGNASKKSSSSKEDEDTTKLLVLNVGSPGPRKGKTTPTQHDRNKLFKELMKCTTNVDLLVLSEVRYTTSNIRKKFDLDDKIFDLYPTSQAQSKIVWKRDRFEQFKLDESQKFFDNLSHEKYPSLIGCGLSTRLSFTVLQKRSHHAARAIANVYILVISWHGPHKMNSENKLALLKKLLQAT
jgi:hypothetical protein